MSTNFYDNPSWADVLNDNSLFGDFMDNFFERESVFRPVECIGDNAIRFFRKQLTLDMEFMAISKIPAEDIPEPFPGREDF